MSEHSTIQLDFELTNEMINAVITTALEGGINYWCRSAIPQGNLNEGEYASDCVSRGVDLLLMDSEDNDESYLLTKENFTQGVQKYFENNPTTDRDIEYMDAEEADQVIQYAVLGEIVFG